jgi:hypothetical protein
MRRASHRWRPPLALLGTWAALLVLLGLTVTLAYQPLGAFNTRWRARSPP